MSGLRTAVSHPRYVARHPLRQIDNRLGRLIYDEPQRFSSRLVGHLALRKCRMLSDKFNVPDTREGRELRNTGAIELDRPIDNETISSVSTMFDEIIEENQHTYSRGAGDKDYSWGISSSDGFSYAKKIPEIEGIFSKQIRDVIESYYGVPFKPVRINIWRNHHVPPEVVESSEAYSNYWHLDPHTIDHLKLFVYLSDVSETEGPFHYISREDTQSIADQSYVRHVDGVPNEKVEREANVNKFTGGQGSVALCNTTTNLHRAGIPDVSKQRDLLQIMLAPAAHPFPDDWLTSTEYNMPNTHRNGFGRIFAY